MAQKLATRFSDDIHDNHVGSESEQARELVSQLVRREGRREGVSEN